MIELALDFPIQVLIKLFPMTYHILYEDQYS